MLTPAGSDPASAERALRRARARAHVLPVVSVIIMFGGALILPFWLHFSLPRPLAGSGREWWIVLQGLLFAVGMWMLGAPGRSWTRYAFSGWLRNETPAWWKRVARSIMFAALTVAVNELSTRPVLEGRRVHALDIGMRESDISSAINHAIEISYIASGVALLWVFIGDHLGRVLLPLERRALLKHEPW